MKVKDFAESQGITTQAVYQRLKSVAKKNGQLQSDYISADTGEITEEGYKILQTLYKVPVKQKEKKPSQNDLQAENIRLNETVKSLERAIADKEKIIEDKEKQLAMFLADKAKEIARLEETIAHERQTNKLLIETLPKERPGFFKRLFSGSGKQDQKQ